jgi:ABC-type branched-subunit amino acid transport system substrate-binding protein
MAPFAPTRRALGLLALPTLALAGCLGEGGRREAPVVATPATPVESSPSTSASGTIGSGSVKVALILPLTGPGQGAVAAASLRNAAEMAIAEFQGPDLALRVWDDRGTAEGAREAATGAVADGAELIIGPLFAPAVAAAGQVAKAAGRPVIAFSTDTSVASRGVYLLSFTVGPEVDRVLAHAAAQGRRSLAALIPESVYGNVVEAEFREAAARRGMRVAGIERYPAGQPGPAVARLAGVIGGERPSADALLLPDSGDGLAAVAASLNSAGYNPARVKPLGTGVWADGRAARLPALAGGWYAAPDGAGFASFAGRYRAKYGGEPTRIASLAYDAVSLAAALARTQGSQRFSEAVLQSPSGFAGADGTFRFRADGTNDRTLAIMELRAGAASVVSPAPKTLDASGT